MQMVRKSNSWYKANTAKTSVGVAGTVGHPTLEKADPAKMDATRSVALVTTSLPNSCPDSGQEDLENHLQSRFQHLGRVG